MSQTKKRAAKKKARTQARRKANAYLKSVYGTGWHYKRLGKACASTKELLIELAILGEKNTSDIILWAESRADLPASVPSSVARKNKKKRAPKAKKIKTHNDKLFVQTKEFLQSWDWRTLRYKVLLEYGRRCMCCGATPDDGVTILHVDHIKPRHTHPQLALDQSNLQILCGVCNQGKGAWDDTDFRDNVIEYDFQCRLATAAKENQ